jgi:hypothetical protein
MVFVGHGLESTPGRDFALLIQCNHTIMTIGTYGFWAACLAGGDTVYLANFAQPNVEFLTIFKVQACLPARVGGPQCRFVSTLGMGLVLGAGETLRNGLTNLDPVVHVSRGLTASG